MVLRPNYGAGGTAGVVVEERGMKKGSPKSPQASSTEEQDGVSLFGATEQWVPPEKQLGTRPAGSEAVSTTGEQTTDAVKPAEVSKPADPATPRKSSKRYPEEVRGALKSLRKSLFSALKKKGQLNGLEYVLNLLMDAESYRPPEPKPPPERKPQKEDTTEDEKADAKEEGTHAKSPEKSDGEIEEDYTPQKSEARYEDDGVKPHTRTERSTSKSMRMVPGNAPTPKKNVGFAPDLQSKPPGGAVTSQPAKPIEQQTKPKKPKPSYTLPPKWVTKKSSKRQKTYYYNTDTGESTWRHPGLREKY
jgi:hypothetical protein